MAVVPGEVGELIGPADARRVARSLRRLAAAKLLSVDDGNVSMPKAVAQGALDELSLSAEARSMMRGRSRRVPVPRRLMRWLAACGTAARISVAFGHLLRCLYYRQGQCVSGGWCRAGCVAEVFGVSLRAVKAGRAELLGSGWLVRHEVSQWQVNRWGQACVINLDWSGTSVNLHAEQRRVEHRSAPPLPTPRTSSSRRTKKPAQRGDGVRENGTPTFTKLEIGDLVDIERLRVLFAQAVDRRWVTRSEADWLNFASSAHYATRKATKNAPGLFRWLVTRREWSRIAEADEAAARRRMRDEHPEPSQGQASGEGIDSLRADPRIVLDRLRPTRRFNQQIPSLGV